MKLRLTITYDYEVQDALGRSAKEIALHDLRGLTSERISIDEFVEVLGGRVNFAIEPLD